MGSRLTVRTDDDLRKALERLARMRGTTLSELVRDILRGAVMECPVAGRAGHLKGGLRLEPQDPEPWRERLRERNWRQR